MLHFTTSPTLSLASIKEKAKQIIHQFIQSLTQTTIQPRKESYKRKQRSNAMATIRLLFFSMISSLSLGRPEKMSFLDFLLANTTVTFNLCIIAKETMPHQLFKTIENLKLSTTSNASIFKSLTLILSLESSLVNCLKLETKQNEATKTLADLLSYPLIFLTKVSPHSHD